MIIYIQLEGSRRPLKLVLENDGSETIEGVKQMIHDKLGTQVRECLRNAARIATFSVPNSLHEREGIQTRPPAHVHTAAQLLFTIMSSVCLWFQSGKRQVLASGFRRQDVGQQPLDGRWLWHQSWRHSRNA